MVLNKNITPKLSNNNNSKKHTGFRLKKEANVNLVDEAILLTPLTYSSLLLLKSCFI